MSEFQARSNPFAAVPRGLWVAPSAGSHGGLDVEPILPQYLRLATARRLFVAGTGAGTAVAPVAAMPTTAAAWALYNSHATRHLVPLKIACYSVSGTLGLGMTLLVANSTAAQGAALTKYTNSTISGVTPGSIAVPGGIFASGATLAGAPSWLPLASRDQASAVSVGSGLVADCEGIFAIPPLYAMGVQVLAPLGTTALFGVSILWAEVDLTIE
jgi:hypothetical protein